MTDMHPFGSGASTPLRTALRLSAYAALVAAAGGTAWYLTRGTPEETATAESHQHGAASAAGSAAPVSLGADAARRIGVTYASVTSGSLSAGIRTVGQVTWDETRVKVVAPRIEGWVEQLHVDFTGRDVQEGEPMLTIYSPMLVAAQEELLLAVRLLREVAGGTEDARRNAEAMVASARRRLSYWDIPASHVEELERTGTVSRTFTIRSPLHGVVVEKSVLAGQRIMEGETLFRIADLGTVWVEGEVFEQDLAQVRVGSRVTVEAQALSDQPRSGTVTYIYPTVDPATRTARIRVVLANPGRRLLPGMYASLLIPGASRVSVLTVPRGAVLATGTRSIVFVRQEDGTLVPREVVTGATNDDRVEVLRGLKAGDVVVASATFLIDAESNLGAALAAMEGMGMSQPAGQGAGSPDTSAKRPPTPQHDHKPE